MGGSLLTIRRMIHVNQGNIKGNLKTRRTGRDQELKPVITIKQGKKMCTAIARTRPSKVIYGHDKTLLSCGRVWSLKQLLKLR